MFFIEITRPVKLGIKDPEDTTVSEAIESIYSNAGRMINMHWNDFVIPLFGYSLGDIYYNIINILNDIKSGKSFFTENFLDAVFTAKWVCEIRNDMIKITAHWTTIANLEKEDITIDKLKQVSNVVLVDLEEFTSGWKKLLRIIKEDLITVGYDNTLEGFEYLEKL
jgi:hypothetical protein